MIDADDYEDVAVDDPENPEGRMRISRGRVR